MLAIHFGWIGSPKMDIDGAIKMIEKFDKDSNADLYFWILSDEISDIEPVKSRLSKHSNRLHVVLWHPERLGDGLMSDFEKLYPNLISPSNRKIVVAGFETLKLLYYTKMYVQAKDLFSFLILYLYGGYFLDANITPNSEFDPNAFTTPTKFQIPCQNPNASTTGFYAILKSHINRQVFESGSAVSQILQDDFKHRDDYFFFPRIDLWFVASPDVDEDLLHAINEFTLFFELLIPNPKNSKITVLTASKFLRNATTAWVSVAFDKMKNGELSNPAVKDLAVFLHYLKSKTYPMESDDFTDPQNKPTLEKLCKFSSDFKQKFQNNIYDKLTELDTVSVLRLSKFVRMRIGLAYSWTVVAKTIRDKHHTFFASMDALSANPSKDEIREHVSSIFTHLMNEGVFLEAVRTNSSILILSQFRITKIHSGSWLIRNSASYPSSS